MPDDISQWYLDALAGKKVEVHADSPQLGYYKLREGKDGPWVPVMIRLDPDTREMRCRVGDNSGVDPLKVWTWCASHPITKADAKVAFITGHFPGDAPTIGDNSKEDPRTLVQQLGDYLASTLDWLKGKKAETLTANDANQVANRRSEILRIKKLVENEWDAEIAPAKDVIAQAKEKYDGIVKSAQNVNDTLRVLATAFAKVEEKRLQEEQKAKYEAERKATEAARAEIEKKQAQLMRDDPIAALTSEPEALPDLPPPPAPVKVALGGQVGKVTGLRSYWEAEITDFDQALAHYSKHPDVRALILKLAKADVKNSKGTVQIPGIRGFEDRRVA